MLRILKSYQICRNLCSQRSLIYKNSFLFSNNQEGSLPETDPQSIKDKETQKQVKTPKTPKIPPLKDAAIVLSGCGVYDGSEIIETVSLFIACHSLKVKFQCYAPDKIQSQVINHLTGQAVNETRNVLIESARIARGQIKNIKELNVDNHDAILFPGGFGVAKNLSDFAIKGENFTVDEQVEKILKEFHAKKKPIGLACISPILAAKVFGTINGGPGCTVTLGKDGAGWPYAETMQLVEKWGSKHRKNGVSQVSVDKRNLIYSVPAFMYETQNFSQIYQAIHLLVSTMKNRNFKSKEKSE